MLLGLGKGQGNLYQEPATKKFQPHRNLLQKHPLRPRAVQTVVPPRLEPGAGALKHLHRRHNSVSELN